MSSDLELELVGINENESFKNLDCGVPSINKYLLDGDAYYEHIMKLANTKLIRLDRKIVGYFSMQFKEIKIEESNILYPCICLKYICTDNNYQNMGIGTKVLNYVVGNSKNISDFIGCRCLLIDAITSKIQWYKDRGFDFLEDDDNIVLEDSTVKMIIDFRDNEVVEDYFEV
ncbi:hypothetical protein [Desulfitobacterium sp.]|uniref:hypothetical protein n=1 Tax=Desulfitobacterium sp. TaxID=49981 RepID=UPI002BE4D9A2|nr:hypothetical protein [Desulfitobacterium sp.]HVJ48164.1 hypothetical protein [Desulfitobacterium sp.]